MNTKIQNELETLIEKVASQRTNKGINLKSLSEDMSQDMDPNLTEEQEAILDYLEEHTDDFIIVAERYYEKNKDQIIYSEAEIEQETIDLYQERGRAIETLGSYKENMQWSNDINNCVYTPARTYNKANSILALQDIVQQAKLQGAKIRFMGNGHSYSTITAVSKEDYIILPNHLNAVIDKDHPFALLKKENEAYSYLNNPSADNLFETEAGISIANLNHQLFKAGKALKTMGSWSAQTLLGVISSSTHGSRHDIGPIPDMVKSILIVARDGELLRIEPNNGITNPDKYNQAFNQPNTANSIQLIQDDQYFYSVLVNMACMGVVYSVVMEVDPKHLLKESRQLSTLDYELTELAQGYKAYMSKDNTIDFNLLVNPYKKANGSFTCIRTRRMTTTQTEKVFNGEGKRSFWLTCATTCKLLSTVSTSCLTHARAWRKVRNLLQTALKGMHDRDHYIDQSDKVFITPRPKDIKGLALEMILPFKYTKEAIDDTLSIIEELGKRKGRYKRLITAPLSIRFVGKSKAYLSPFTACDPESNDANTDLFVCIEISCLLKTKHWEYSLNKIQERMLEKYKSKLRMHWGLNFGTLDASNYNLQSRYPKLKEWLEVYNDLNKHKVFSNKFTEQMGLDSPDVPLV
ncbi:MAG: FAD-binding protein [Aureispira sp.]